MLVIQAAGIHLTDQRVIHRREPPPTRLHPPHQVEQLLITTRGQIQPGQPLQHTVQLLENAGHLTGELAAGHAPNAKRRVRHFRRRNPHPSQQFPRSFAPLILLNLGRDRA
jgi:hypothetical protein